MVARRFVLWQAPGGEGEGEEHVVEYDTDHGLDVLRFQIFSLTSVPPDLQKIVVEADGSVVDDGTDLESISEGLRLVSIDGDEGDDAAAAEAARAQEKSDEELARMIQIEVEAVGSVVEDGTNLESISEGFRLVEIEEEGEDVDEAGAAAARVQEKFDEELARMLQAEEEALLLQQYNIRNDGGEMFREKVEPYMRQVLMYEDPERQEAAWKTVPIDELEEKALVSLAKHEMDYGGSDAHVSPRVHQHPPNANPFTNSSIQTSTDLYGQATAGFAPRPSLSDQSKNTIFSNALSSPVRRSLQNYHLTQGAGNGGCNTEANLAGQNRETNSPSSNDTSMDMVSDSAGNEYY